MEEEPAQNVAFPEMVEAVGEAISETANELDVLPQLLKSVMATEYAPAWVMVKESLLAPGIAVPF